MQRPSNMTPEAFEKHRVAAEAERKRRAAVEANPTDTILALEARVAALEGGKKTPAAKKAGK